MFSLIKIITKPILKKRQTLFSLFLRMEKRTTLMEECASEVAITDASQENKGLLHNRRNKSNIKFERIVTFKKSMVRNPGQVNEMGER